MDIIATGKLCIVIEMKPLRLDAIFEGELTGEEMKNWKKELSSYKYPEIENVLLQLPLTKMGWDSNKGTRTVKDLVKKETKKVNRLSATAQVRDLVGKRKTLYKFVAIQVGYPFVVKQIE
jgi:hypothetical protein